MMDNTVIFDFFDLDVSRHRSKISSAKNGMDMKAVRLWDVIKAARENPERIIFRFQMA
ncbi:MAG: hypothetical protein UX10_C0038G0004 [Candidatus Magasanikbacteria bacterium GW2011_GWA2_45_39]|uniref:Uncharacterized protein n=1 Tax=Candidatus Magasanikbacteria bacterium GW2011_GWA2_45_39 TaxID=1619041 RepID=A0A0G1QBY7_9BACT|nr:MAG: hypothetical protein UX10_C0038G0004 [Candidatus Magasanikbacteria bacterium GW2011_GWA2_45_39]